MLFRTAAGGEGLAVRDTVKNSGLITTYAKIQAPKPEAGLCLSHDFLYSSPRRRFPGGLLSMFVNADFSLPQDTQTNFLMLLRWVHLVAGITWVGLLYFFNLVNVPLMKELDVTTKGKVLPA